MYYNAYKKSPKTKNKNTAYIFMQETIIRPCTRAKFVNTNSFKDEDDERSWAI